MQFHKDLPLKKVTSMFRNRYKLFIFLFIFITIGAFLRFYNLNWDQGNYFHPDERNIANAVSRIIFFSHLDPKFFAYGGFLIYLYRATGDIMIEITKSSNWVYAWGDINIIGRFYSAFFSTLTIPLVFFLTKNVFNKFVAFIATILTTFTASFIQTSHFSITENFLVFASIALCLASISILKERKIKNYIICGFILGIALATKISALPLIIFPLTAYFLSNINNPLNLIKKGGLLFVLGLTALGFFTIFSPYTFIDWEKFIESMRYESGVALGTLPVPYTLQFTNTTSYLFQIKNFLWQIGPISLLLIPSFILLIINIVRKKDHKRILLILFPIIYFLCVGYWHTKFIRFMLPILPFVVIIISYLLSIIYKKIGLLGRLLVFLSIFFTILWGFAFFSIYTREQTRISASKWIYSNIASGSKILGEHWDDGIPITINRLNPNMYQIEQLTIYEPDNYNKINYYSEKLSNADYIVINSRRLYGTLINLPDKYPITSHYYKLLFNDELGYKKVAEFSSYPTIFGIEINDDKSEETFQVYDHPKVMVFKNTNRLSKMLLSEMLNGK